MYIVYCDAEADVTVSHLNGVLTTGGCLESSGSNSYVMDMEWTLGPRFLWNC